MEPRELWTHEAAQERILSALSPLETEQAPIDEALGRALSDDVEAVRTVPPWDNSAMDGYALRSADAHAAPVRLTLIGTLFAGDRPRQEVGPGQCIRIMTGAPLPSGADAVVMQEKTRRLDSGEVELLEPVARGSAIRARGEDATSGSLLLGRGAPLGIPELALALGQGFATLPVPRRPRVAILSTGDELRRSDEPSGEGIVDTNGPSLALSVRRAGGAATYLGIARDSESSIREKLEAALGFDVVLTSAGVSVGDRDFVKGVLTRLGVELLFAGVAIKPGKPLAFGLRGRSCFFGLPGNPASSLVTFELFVRPALRRLLGHRHCLPLPVGARSEVKIKKSKGLAQFTRVSVAWREGELWAQPLASQTSGAVRSAATATHLLHLPRESAGVGSGDPVELLPVQWIA